MWQKKDSKLGPVVIVNLEALSEMRRKMFGCLKGIIYDEKAMSWDEKSTFAKMPDWERCELKKNVAKRSVYLRKCLDAPKKVEIWDAMQPKELSEKLKEWQKRREGVAVFWLGSLPKPIFDMILWKANLFSVYEGQATASTVLSWGKHYIHLPKCYDFGTKYPSLLLQSNNAGLVAQELTSIAYRIGNAISTEISNGWPFQQSVEKAGKFLKELYNNEKPSVTEYFKKVKAFYQQKSNDKFLIGLAFMEHVMQGKQMLAAAATLDELYAQLRENLKDQRLEPLPVLDALGVDRIAGFSRKILSRQQWVIAEARVTADNPTEVKEITVSGHTTFLGQRFDVSLVFTAPLGPIKARLRLTNRGAWGLEALPWVPLESAGFAVEMGEGYLMPRGWVFGSLKGTGLELSMELPVQDYWLLRGTFPKPQPVSRFFALAGGVNPVASLPEPLRALGDLGLSTVEILVRPPGENKLPSVESMAFTIASGGSWPLLPGIDVAGLEISTVVFDPGDTSARRVKVVVTGRFRIGEGEKAGVVKVAAAGPAFRITGNLESGAIKFSDVLKAFLKTDQVHLPTDPAITGLGFDLDWRTKWYGVTCGLQLDWQPLPIFTVKELGFGVRGQGKKKPAGYLSGAVEIGPQTKKIPVRLRAAYPGTGKGLVLEGRQTGGEISLKELAREYLQVEPDLDIKIKDLGARIDTGNNAWSITGKAATQWKLPFVERLETAGQMTLGWDPQNKYFGQLEGSARFSGVKVGAGVDFKGKEAEYYLVWVAPNGAQVQGTVKPSGDDWVATIECKDMTIGGMVELFVSWATGQKFGLAPPWDLLNHIKLNPKLEFTFAGKKLKQVAFAYDIGQELGFPGLRLERIAVTYDTTKAAKGKRGAVAVKLEGSFFWLKPGESLDWDATEPEKTPAPPGGGSKYLELRLLALGQHVSIQGYEQFESIQQAIRVMRGLKEPEPHKIPLKPPAVAAAGQLAAGVPGAPGEPYYNPQSAWLVATDLGILKVKEKEEESLGLAGAAGGKPAQYVVALSLLFNDPNLYGLRLALAGEQVKELAGLAFEVMYQRLSDTLGVFTAEVTLPDSLRTFDAGPATITLPVFGIAVYTNGEFRVDLGFPWNLDFSRSATVELIVYGVPILGSGGLYFGVLSSASSRRVPAVKEGYFNPVLTLGLGLQLGLGKSFQKGPLKAGFSLTVLGVVEGVLARWNPPNPQLESDFYYWLQGTLGIAGKLYGKLDFSVVKADVNVALVLATRATLEICKDLALSVIARVQVAVTIVLGTGRLTIELRFSFRAEIEESFLIKMPGECKWTPKELAGPVRAGLEARRERRLLALAQPQPATDHLEMKWENLQPGTKEPLKVYLAPVLTATGDGVPQQKPCYVVQLFIETLPRQAPAPEGPEASFAALCKEALRWVVAATQPGPMTSAEVDAMTITRQQLTNLLQYLSDPRVPVRIPKTAVDNFLSKLRVRLLETGDQVSGTFFPMLPDLELALPPYTGNDPIKYTFAKFNTLSTAYLEDLRKRFDELAVLVEEEGPRYLLAEGEKQPSMASFVYSEYFLLIVRQMVQAALDGLRNFRFDGVAGKPAAEIVRTINEWMQGAAEALDAATLFTVEDLFRANSGHRLATGQTMYIGKETYQTREDDTLAGVAAKFGVEVASLAAANGHLVFVGEGLLNAPELPQLRVGALLGHIERTDGIRYLSGMGGRFFLHGLRLPTAGVKWYDGKARPDWLGLYAMTGQQVPLPSDQPKEDDSLFRLNVPLEWIELG